MDNGIGRNFGDLLRGGERIQREAKRPLSQRDIGQIAPGPAGMRGRRQKDLCHIAGGGADRRRTVQVV